MASKALLVLGVLLFTAILVSAEVAAKELTEETNKQKESGKGLQDYGHDGGNYGRGGGDYNRGGGGGDYHRGGGDDYHRGGGGDYHRGGGGDYHRGGGGDYHRGGGGDYNHGGGNHGYNPPRCYYGCCHHGNYGGCYCCASADELPEAAYLPERNV